jgi:hypothetical protein
MSGLDKMTRFIVPILVILLVSGPVLADNHGIASLQTRLACRMVDYEISELIKLAPKGTGVVNRTRAWFENLGGVFADLFLGGDKLSEVEKAVNRIDINHAFLYFDSMRILNAGGEYVEEFMPSKLSNPHIYIIELNAFKKWLLDPECKRYKSG